MPSNQTPNYRLSQWSRDDRILMDDFNADNSKIDEVLKAHADALAGKGNCQIEHRSINDPAQHGQKNPLKIEFPRPPLFYLLFDGNNLIVGSAGTHATVVSIGPFVGQTSVSWSGNTATFTALNFTSYIYHVISFYAQ